MLKRKIIIDMQCNDKIEIFLIFRIKIQYKFYWK